MTDQGRDDQDQDNDEKNLVEWTHAYLLAPT
jgi:hypothetical protein